MENAKKKQVIFAVVIGLAAVVVTQMYLHEERARYQPDAVVDVVVAKEPLEKGKPMLRSQAAKRRVPRGIAPGTAIPAADVESFLGQKLSTDVPANDYILQTYFQPGPVVATTLSEEVTGKNARAFTIQVSPVSSLAESLAVGDSVDIVYTFNVPGSSEQMSVVLLQNIPVIATGEYAPKDHLQQAGERERYNTVTLLLDAQDAVKLNYAEKSGSIDVMLRNREDNESLQMKPITGVKDVLSPEGVQLLETRQKEQEQAAADPDMTAKQVNDFLAGMSALQDQAKAQAQAAQGQQQPSAQAGHAK